MVRHPDENHEVFWRYLLERNARMYGVHFCADAVGDVYLVGRVSLDAVTPDELDRLLGCVLSTRTRRSTPCSSSGFAESIRREWGWRVSRGESLANLRAFARFADPPSTERPERTDRLARMTQGTSTLVLLRHGESEWNAKNLFTGWVDVDLSERGLAEAAQGGRMLADAGLLPDVLHTSVLRRAITHRDDSRWTPATGTGSRCAARGGSTSGTTARCRARTRSRRSPSSARSSSCCGGARTTSRRRRSRTTTSSASTATRATRRCRPSCGRAPSACRTSSRGCCRTGTTRSCPTCAPVRPSWSPRTATRCARWSSTSTTSRTRTSPRSTSRPGSRCCTSWTPTCGRCGAAGLPRPGRGGRRDHRRREPGPLTRPAEARPAQVAARSPITR